MCALYFSKELKTSFVLLLITLAILSTAVKVVIIFSWSSFVSTNSPLLSLVNILSPTYELPPTTPPLACASAPFFVPLLVLPMSIPTLLRASLTVSHIVPKKFLIPSNTFFTRLVTELYAFLIVCIGLSQKSSIALTSFLGLSLT